jgi:hypothetical protein
MVSADEEARAARRLEAERKLGLKKVQMQAAVQDWQKAEQAVNDRTARLRQLRLAKEAEDRAAAEANPAPPKRKTATRRTAV